ncbi:MAG: serine acetyltransferase [Xanthobacteraceae bacterium]|nr:serine acetyltransferase [Xanthobacteraceae bacterium]
MTASEPGASVAPAAGRGPSAWREDLAANAGLTGLKGFAVGWITSPGFVTVTWWRLARALRRRGRAARILSWVILRQCLVRRGCHISLLAEIGPGLTLPHPTSLVVGEGVRIGRRVTLYQNVTLGRRDVASGGYPTIGDDAVVYAGAVVIGPVVVGAAATIAANAVVNRDVPAGSVAAGAPARIVARRVNAGA